MINVITLFSGYDSQCLALNRLGVDYDLAAWCEIDRNAIKAHDALFPQWSDRNLGDVSKVDWTDWRKQHPQQIDLLTYSSPCITEDMLILTERGYVPMKNVSVGDAVLTKSNTMHRVLKKFDNGTHPTYYLEAMGCEGIQCTDNHKFYVRTLERKWRNEERKYSRVFSEPDFVEAKELRKSVHYLGIPVNDRSEVFYTNETSFWYFVGMYVGDGWLSARGNEILICGNEKKLTKLTSIIPQEWNWTINTKTKSCARLRFNNRDIYQFLYDYIGTGCNDKRIPKKILDMPIEQLTAFYEGYRDSDGCEINGNIVQFTSVNRNLIYSISAIINKIYKRPVCIYKNKVRPKTIIEGREVNQQDWYQLRFRKEPHKQQQAFYENGYIWYPFRKLEPAGEAHVYNMEVEDDHSYILQGCVSKNCQDFSSAGLQRGGKEGSGTRSGLLWETERAIRELRPKHLVFENVRGLLSSKFIDTFHAWEKRLNGYGYTNFSQLMNAKDYGVPQNRLRIFMISILDCDKQYHFPKPFKLERRLKDVLEQNVDERYYLKDERVAKLIQETETHRERGNGFAFRPHTPEEIASTVKCSGIGDKTDNFVAEPQVLGWSRNEKGEITDRHPVSVANCVTAGKRDNTQNYVMEPTIYGLPHGHYEGDLYTDYAPTVKSSAYATNNPLIEPCIAAMRGRDNDNPNDCAESTDKYSQHLELKPDGTSNTLTSVAKDNLLVEPAILTPVRTEYGKAVRKQYGDNNLPESRHNLTVLQPKHDGTSNTLTSVTKDNLLIEPRCQQIGNIHKGESNPQSGRVYSAEGISPTVDCCQGGNREPKIIEDFYGTVRDPRVYTEEAPTLRADRTGLMATEGIRIRRLTERELYRLMDVEEKDIDTLLNSGIAKTQHAKLAGNSIVVACLYYIFDRLFVHTDVPEDKLF